ncbi:carbohydrate binding domain-containing protein [Psychromonas sp. MME2]|uniref:carbohydrate binding domain-containing protein n=1 Tax=unclassified Psychromonas TaxID=2614957 RepID=UPI00339CD25A
MMLLNKKLPALLICSTLTGSLLFGCSTTSDNVDTLMKGELLRNGQFTNGFDGWWATGAELNVKDTEGCINITTAGSKPWDVILGQGGFGLIKGMSYTLEFTARANVDTKFNAVIQHEGAPYTNYFSKEISVSSKSAPFTLTFTHQESSDPKTDFQLQFGAQKIANVCVRNLSLKSN